MDGIGLVLGRLWCQGSPLGSVNGSSHQYEFKYHLPNNTFTLHTGCGLKISNLLCYRKEKNGALEWKDTNRKVKRTLLGTWHLQRQHANRKLVTKKPRPSPAKQPKLDCQKVAKVVMSWQSGSIGLHSTLVCFYIEITTATAFYQSALWAHFHQLCSQLFLSFNT